MFFELNSAKMIAQQVMLTLLLMMMLMGMLLMLLMLMAAVAKTTCYDVFFSCRTLRSRVSRCGSCGRR